MNKIINAPSVSSSRRNLTLRSSTKDIYIKINEVTSKSGVQLRLHRTSEEDKVHSLCRRLSKVRKGASRNEAKINNISFSTISTI